MGLRARVLIRTTASARAHVRTRAQAHAFEFLRRKLLGLLAQWQRYTFEGRNAFSFFIEKWSVH